MSALSFGFCAAFAVALALEAPQEPTLRVEHFELRNGPREIVGVARLLRRDQRGEMQLELELEHFGLASTLRLVETHGAASAQGQRHELVWREQLGASQRAAGRCAVVRWTERNELESLQWGALEPLRDERALAARPLFPLEQWELERSGELRSGERYDPLGDRIDAAWRVARFRVAAGALACVREAAGDEPLAMRRVYAGSALLAFRFGPGAPTAVAIPQQRWAELRAARTAQQATAAQASPVTGSFPALVSLDDYSGALVRRPASR
jgi:hypothetical protein